MWSTNKFKLGDRIVTTFFTEDGEHGEVVSVQPDGYGVMLDNDRGPFGDGSYFVTEESLRYEEEL